MENKDRIIHRCEICQQPTTRDYLFELSYYESGKRITRQFCGSGCLREWVAKELDKIHLDLFTA
ncbi:hypothetical protein A3K78_04880 [Candidatus Bathyarchaeota archaeon RBG_13_52_12]|nr:MAG: hypothetical protein A3K78_04880 [Candidatus Bathyarchaeota archaeon RBG_13_52_12]